MTKTSALCVTVVKSGSVLKPSETFLRAHMEQLPFRTIGLIGHPGERRRHGSDGTFLQSQTFGARGIRRLLDRVGVASVRKQDTRALANLLRRERIEVMMAEYGPTALSVAAACAEAGVPLVTHFHGWDAYVLAPGAGTRAAYNALFEQSAAIVAVSRHMRTHLIALGSPAERTVWNPCGAAPDPTPADPAQAPPHFVSIGRWAPKKATVVMLLAFAQVLRAVPDARLSLIGSTSDPQSDQLMRALGIGHAVTLYGPLPHAEVLAQLRTARCYLHPSVTAPDGDMEGTPVSVLEGMACGLPIVSTRHGGILDVLDGTNAGVLVDEFDVQGTAAAMLTYATSPTLAGEHGSEGRRLLAEQWSMARSLSRLTEILHAARRADTAMLRELSNDQARLGAAPGQWAAAGGDE